MIVLDTHTLIWWIDNPQKLSIKAKKAIEKEKHKEKSILVSSMSVFEIFLLTKKDRLVLSGSPDAWLERIESLPSVKFVPIDNKIAAQSVNLPDFLNKDPADRMIVATAREYGATLITSDKKILNYKHVQTL